MHYYRVYRLDRSDKITDSKLIEAGSDQDALGLAGREWNDAIEVWDQARLVGEVKAALGTMRARIMPAMTFAQS